MGRPYRSPCWMMGGCLLCRWWPTPRWRTRRGTSWRWAWTPRARTPVCGCTRTRAGRSAVPSLRRGPSFGRGLFVCQEQASRNASHSRALIGRCARWGCLESRTHAPRGVLATSTHSPAAPLWEEVRNPVSAQSQAPVVWLFMRMGVPRSGVRVVAGSGQGGRPCGSGALSHLAQLYDVLRAVDEVVVHQVRDLRALVHGVGQLHIVDLVHPGSDHRASVNAMHDRSLRSLDADGLVGAVVRVNDV